MELCKPLLHIQESVLRPNLHILSEFIFYESIPHDNLNMYLWNDVEDQKLVFGGT